jgi:predicted phosphodiesterase
MASIVNRVRIPKTINPLGWIIVCVSDTHSKLMKISEFPQGDLIIHGGDFSNVGELKDTQKFHDEFAELPYPVKIFIAGNHDLSLDKEVFCDPNRAFDFERYSKRLGISTEEYHQRAVACVRDETCVNGFLRYLQDESVLVSSGEDSSSRDLKVFGSPWQPEFCAWAFNVDRGAPLAKKWEKIPEDTDVLITHGPPNRILDKTSSGVFAGCEELRNLLDQGGIKPRLHIFGHIHETYGAERVGNTLFVNACTCTLNYRPTNPPIVIFLPFDKNLPAEVISK